MSVAEADYSITQLAMEEQNARQNRYKGDDKLYVRFYMSPTHDPEASKTEGRPIFREIEWVHIQVPGDRNNIIQRPANDMDRGRFADRYAKFKANAQEAADGTALEHWPRVTRAQVEELKYFGCRTVEQLANMSDGNAAKFPGIGMLRTWARDYMEEAKAGAASSKLRGELESRDNEIAALKKAVEELSARVAESEEE